MSVTYLITLLSVQSLVLGDGTAKQFGIFVDFIFRRIHGDIVGQGVESLDSLFIDQRDNFLGAHVVPPTYMFNIHLKYGTFFSS